MLKIQKFDVYQTERNLITWNFKPDERQRLLSAIERNPDLKDVLNQSYPILTQSAYGLTNVQITRIACGNQGIENLRTFTEHYADLKKFGFNFLHFLQMFYHFEAYQIFPIIRQLIPFLTENRINPTEITGIIKGITQPSDILLMKDHLKSLIELKLSPININFLLKNNLFEKFISYQRSVNSTKKCNLKLNVLIRECLSVTHLGLYFESCNSLNALGLNNSIVFALTTAPYAQELIHLTLESFPILMKNGFNIDELSELLVATNCIQNLNTLVKLAPKLLSYGYTRNEILRLVYHDDGPSRLQLLYSKHLEYRCLDYSRNRIFMLVMAETNNKQDYEPNDEMSQYLQEIDALREDDMINEAKASFLSLFAPKTRVTRVPTPLSDEHLELLEEGLLPALS